MLGDIHGAYQGLIQCLARADFDYQKDHLIFLGDVCDGWSETALCMEELLKIKHLTYILGNHDLWAIEWGNSGVKDEFWLQVGGKTTVASYPDGIPESHMRLFRKGKDCHILDAKLFVHAGINPDLPLDQQDQSTFLWDRTLFNLATKLLKDKMEQHLGEYEEIYIGHTPTINIGINKPVKACNVWLMDSGAGWGGHLSIMDIASKECFQSDLIKDLYPGEKGRG